MLQVFESFLKSCHILRQRNVSVINRPVLEALSILNTPMSRCVNCLFFQKGKGFIVGSNVVTLISCMNNHKSVSIWG